MESALRILDANANRAREALRVLEDYARFALNAQPLQQDLKSLRHDLQCSLALILPLAILHRDITEDVGKDSKNPAELSRADLPAVINANAKRLGEALRVLEEIAKINHPAAARTLESLRYRFYQIEQRLAMSLHSLNPAPRLANARLYVLITESACKKPWKEVTLAALDGGADILQLREKDLDAAELLQRACWFADACRGRALSILNDRPDVAILANVDGVHVGQSDLPPTQLRKLIGPHKLIGLSTHNLLQAQQAPEQSANYVGIGPIFKSSTKPRDFTVPPDTVREIAQLPLPAFAIAGISESNLDHVLSLGITRIAVTSAITQSDDPKTATARLKSHLR